MMLGIPAASIAELKVTIEHYESSGPNARFENGDTVALRLLLKAKAVADGSINDAHGFEDSLKLDLIEQWARSHKMHLATMLAERLREGKPIRVAIDEVLKAADNHHGNGARAADRG